jgi:hypothetical protein
MDMFGAIYFYVCDDVCDGLALFGAIPQNGSHAGLSQCHLYASTPTEAKIMCVIVVITPHPQDTKAVVDFGMLDDTKTTYLKTNKEAILQQVSDAIDKL